MSRSGGMRLLVGASVSIVLVGLLVRAVDLRDLGAAVAETDLRLLPLAVALHFVGVWVRAVRWGLLLPPVVPPTESLFRALFVGFTVNNLLPARLGDLARAYLLARWHGIAYGATLASLVVERILDGLALTALLLASLAVVPTPTYVLTFGVLMGGAFCGGALLMLLAAWRRDALTVTGGFVARRCPPGLGSKIDRLVTSFADGLGLLRGWGVLLRLALLSLLCWGCELALFYVLMLGFPLPASPALAVLGGVAANFATLLPSSPGYVGTFEAALVKVLVDAAGVSTEHAAAYALVVHATLFIPVVALGTAIMWRADVSFGQVAQAGRDTRGSRPALEPARDTAPWEPAGLRRGPGRVGGPEGAMVADG